ncbi:MAG: hypothetical protein JW703_04715 [Candidatus Diapherotrites archaeon]|nr:hypothetical protein [Candidatus Diapherotrites archaeon]
MPSKILKPHLVRGKPVFNLICKEGNFRLMNHFENWDESKAEKISFMLPNKKISSAMVRLIGEYGSEGKEKSYSDAISKEGNVFRFNGKKWIPLGNIHKGVLVFDELNNDVFFKTASFELKLGNLSFRETKQVVKKYRELVEKNY